jgi:hypothetical protein
MEVIVDSRALILISFVVIALIVASITLVILSAKWRKTKKLRQDFGPEYEHTVERANSRKEAEAELEARQERVASYTIHPITAEERREFTEAWKQTQALFVDEPDAAVTQANTLIARVMKARGYPVADFEQQAADLSVDHASFVENYRLAHRIARANKHGQAGTEECRKALIYYRALFEELLEEKVLEYEEQMV